MYRILIMIFAVVLPGVARAETYEDKAFRKIAAEQGVDENLLRAICWHETKHRPRDLNESDGGEGNSAFGICQVLYNTAAQYGTVDERCKDFTSDTPRIMREYKNCKLFGPETNIRIAAKYLRDKIKENEGNIFEAIASYNTGSYKECRDGWLYYKKKRFKRCIQGGPVNIYYILEIFQALKENR